MTSAMNADATYTLNMPQDDTKEDELQEAKELFKEGFVKILEATKKVSEKIAEGFREGYAKDVTKKGD